MKKQYKKYKRERCAVCVLQRRSRRLLYFVVLLCLRWLRRMDCCSVWRWSELCQCRYSTTCKHSTKERYSIQVIDKNQDNIICKNLLHSSRDWNWSKVVNEEEKKILNLLVQHRLMKELSQAVPASIQKWRNINSRIWLNSLLVFSRTVYVCNKRIQKEENIRMEFCIFVDNLPQQENVTTWVLLSTCVQLALLFPSTRALT